MNYETKRDVFEKALREWDDLVHSCGLQGEEAHGGCEFDPILIKYKKDYDAAVPDYLPVIPECVNYAIEWFKQNDDDLGEVFRNAYEDLVDDWHECPQLEVAETWIINRPDEFARAWLDGYQVEEEHD